MDPAVGPKSSAHDGAVGTTKTHVESCAAAFCQLRPLEDEWKSKYFHLGSWGRIDGLVTEHVPERSPYPL